MTIAPPSSSAMPAAELPKSYAPADAEPRIRELWDRSGCFHVKVDAEGEPYCIFIPPPNVTAALHLGHALNNTLQDVLIRAHRMGIGNKTYKVLWMPGTDHAGIATQAVIEKRLLLQGKKRTDFTREQFVAMVQEWKDEYEATIIEQLKAMGCSCDYERTRFTMDEVCATAVREAFFRLFRDGLIYRGKRLVNWDPVTQTALADDEVEMEEIQGAMHFMRYPLEDGSGHVTVATTRPETYLGDTAVAINPNDPRAKQFVGKKVKLPIVGRVIPIVADDYVVRPVEFGGDPADGKAAIATGFLKVTPAHDPNDYEIGRRHDLPVINVMAPDASISDKHGWTDVGEAGIFLGLSREAARKKVLEEFKKLGLLEAVKPYTHSVGHSYRSHVPIEPYLSDQWYVKVTDERMKGAALRSMSQRGGGDGDAGGTGVPPVTPVPPIPGDGQLTFYPERYAKTFEHWHENLRDWCISRQLWWGHRIPVWQLRVAITKQNAWDEITCRGIDHVLLGEIPDVVIAVVNVTTGERVEPADYRRFDAGELDGEFDISLCGLNKEQQAYFENNGFTQDPDVLDTWFSSGLWPLSTLGWPNPNAFPKETPEGEALLDTFIPSSVLCTAREIITLWVSRMVMFTRYLRGQDLDLGAGSGPLPYKDVFIHAMIQDGYGQKMSKSLGNGVDPRDIIDSHGADALRFVLVQMTTDTQDVRMPVDTVCPHCGHVFVPKTIETSAHHTVADATQICPSCSKKMVSLYGAALGIVKPTAEMPQARNTSSKFDLGRNFANKLWNATRFALSNLSAGADGRGELTLIDRWIITRLHRTLHTVEDAIKGYQFNVYADAMYDFIWRDFCDWYLEAIKPTVKSNPAQQQVLRTVLNASLRLLHPIMPFVTEALWPSVQATGAAGVPGINLPDHEVLAAARWPDIACSVDDKAALNQMERLQSLVNVVRNLRGERKVQPKKKIFMHAPPKVMELLAAAPGVVENLCVLERAEPIGGARPQGAIPLTFEGSEILLSGLVDAVDVGSERSRLQKLIADLEKQIAARNGKLENAGYLAKAPPAVVEETRQMQAKAQSELAAARQALASLG